MNTGLVEVHHRFFNWFKNSKLPTNFAQKHIHRSVKGRKESVKSSAMEKHGPFEAPLKALARGTPSEVGASARLPAQTLAVGGADNGV